MYIILLDLDGREWSWELSDVPLVIGRGENCDIRISDPALSRKHVQVWATGNAVHFRDLGSRNALMLRGCSVTEAILHAGESIEAGLCQFRITDSAPSTAAISADICPTPITLTSREAAYLQRPLPPQSAPPLQRKFNELHALFHFGRSLGSVESMRELTGLLEQTLREHFRPKSLWIVWCYADGSSRHFQPLDSEEVASEPTRRVLEDALRLKQGIIKPVVRGLEKNRRLETIMTVPIVHADRVIGAFILRSSEKASIYAENDLQFALGLAAIVAPHVRVVRLTEQLRRDHEALQARAGSNGQLLGDSSPMVAVREQLVRAGNSALPVLILGETGTGKEIAARMLHENSPRLEGPYVVVNCAAIPANLFESEFFGHEKGAFTGATRQREGRFEEAHGGTLFLDEIGDLTPDNQARILRAIETGSFYRVGGQKLIRVDVRIVSATNKNPEESAFRADLLHRLNAVTIVMPPLRNRTDDIPMLVEHFIRLSNSHGPDRVTGVDSVAIDALKRYHWPGNVRELRTTIDRAILFARSSLLSAADLSLPNGDVANCDTPVVAYRESRDTFQRRTLAELERVHIRKTLELHGGNVAKAATELGINRATLYRKLAEAQEKQLQ